jgi:hypothetical protein
VAVSKQLSTAVLLTYRGEGHTVYGGEDDCVDSAVNTYLLSLTPPANGTQCGNGKPPPANSNNEATPAATPKASAQPRRTATADTPGNDGSAAATDDGGSSSRGWLVFGGGVLVMFTLAAAGTVWMSTRRR